MHYGRGCLVCRTEAAPERDAVDHGGRLSRARGRSDMYGILVGDVAGVGLTCLNCSVRREAES